MKPCLALGLALLIVTPALAQTAAPPTADPFQWLEDVDSPRALSWVEGQNTRTAARLESDARYKDFHAEARAIFTASDRIPWPDFRADGVDNFWQDGDHIHGIWRHTSLSSYRKAQHEWETLLDLDALSRTEGRNWIWKGADCLPPARTRCLVNLSDGGSDAVEVREFDTIQKAFVPGGFRFAAGKQTLDWLDADTLVVARAWTPDEVTTSGYPYVVKRVSRNGSVQEIFRGSKSDVSVSPRVLYDDSGKSVGIVLRRGVDFFRNEYSLTTGTKTVRILLPLKAELQTFVKGRMIFTLKEAWNGFEAGSVIAWKLKDAGPRPELVFQPGPRQAVETVASTAGKLIINLLEDVKGAVDAYDLVGGQWTATRLPLPKNATFQLRSLGETDDRIMISAEGFLDPPSLWLADSAINTVAQIRALPPRFDASRETVSQYWAKSSDGTQIPYFVVRPKDSPLNGQTPTLMYGYGGFELSKPPVYIPEMGKLWLERGGAYVIANIRGGGEFGPAWHEAVLREKRQLAFDDFAAVARDMSARGLTSARRLGIYGRSNGGVLTTVSLTQHPELWTAVVVESPLIDMMRYHKLSAGASWIGEYGDPDAPGDAAFIGAYSAYQNLKPGVAYPEAYITTNTRDDRVHPGHARKFAARLEAMGVPYLYYEQTFGGHANDADPELNARRWARHYVYLAQKLMD